MRIATDFLTEKITAALLDAAECGHLNGFSECVIAENLHESDLSLKSVIEVAAQHGNLGQIPKSLLTPENLTKIGRLGTTPIHCTIINGHIRDVPNLETYLHIRNTDEISVLESAAWHRQLNKIPGLTPEHMLTKNPTTEGTPLHMAAMRGCLSQVPYMLSDQYMHEQDKSGNSPFLLAITHDHEDQIPEELFTAVNLMRINDRGISNLAKVAENGLLGKIPKGLLTEENLLAPFGLVYKSYKPPSALATFFEVFEDRADELLGIEITEKSRSIVGDVWYQKNKEFLHKIKVEKESLATSDSYDVELF